MKNIRFTSTLCALGLAATLTQPVYAQVHSPEALTTVLQRVEYTVRQGRKPIVLFDLDDTLINTRERNLRILKDFAALPQIQSAYPVESTRILNLQVGQIRYLLADTLNSIGINNPVLVKAAGDFWLPRFFSNQYCANDQSNPGSAKYLHLLVRAGAKIVYLTGRDVPRMHEGTVLNLRRNFFPATAENAVLMMKPDPQMDDLLFKKQSFVQIATLGEIVGVFENEPANINAMADAFPQATAIFLDTIHSPKPDVPYSKVFWVLNFINR